MHAFKRTICIAPMLHYTDRHFRFLMRLLSRHTLLYTEMTTTHALLNHPQPTRYLRFNPEEHPIAFQIGGDRPEDLYRCAKMIEETGYDEINFNLGCPSPHAQSGGFGATLINHPEQAAQCIQALHEATTLPLSVKTRIGIDSSKPDLYATFYQFIKTLTQAGCTIFIIHARCADLKHYKPKQNRTLPTLHYDMVYQLKKDCPPLEIILNGSIQTQEEIAHHLKNVDGVMLGRQAYKEPYLFAPVDQDFFNDAHPIPAREEVQARYLEYIKREAAQGENPAFLKRHLKGLFYGCPNARAWRAG